MAGRLPKVLPSGLLFLVALLFSLLPYPSLAETITGRVVGIADGDTVTLLTPNKRQLRIRLAEIDTPEKRQPYGKRARQALSKLVFLREVRAKVVTKDRYGRLVAHLFVGDTWVNREMVCGGHAWVYRKYARSRVLFECEKQARAKKRGLWALPEAQRMPPWEWRKHHRRQKTGVPSPASKAGKGGLFRCGAKRYCREMASCAEAMFYLKQCGLLRLDGDGDGIPCEALCR